MERFLVQVRKLARLHHEHILPILSCDLRDGSPFLVLPYATGGTLRQRHPRGSQLPMEIREHYLHRQLAPAGMALAQCSTGGIGQNEKRRANPQIAAENRENVFMVQTRKFANLHEEAFHLLIVWTSPKDLQRDPRLKVAMLGEIDISETAATNDVTQTIVADLLLLRLPHLLLVYFAVHIYTIPSALPETI